MVKTLPCSAGGAGSIPGWGARIPHASRPKNQNIKRSNIVANLIQILKMVHIKKKKKSLKKIHGKNKNTVKEMKNAFGRIIRSLEIV